MITVSCLRVLRISDEANSQSLKMPSFGLATSIIALVLGQKQLEVL